MFSLLNTAYNIVSNAIYNITPTPVYNLYSGTINYLFPTGELLDEDELDEFIEMRENIHQVVETPEEENILGEYFNNYVNRIEREYEANINENIRIIIEINNMFDDYKRRLRELQNPNKIARDENISNRSREYFEICEDVQPSYKRFAKDFSKFIISLNILLRGTSYTKEDYKYDILKIWNKFFRKTYTSFQPHYYIKIISDEFNGNYEIKSLNIDTLKDVSRILSSENSFAQFILENEYNYNYDFIDQYYELRREYPIEIDFVLYEASRRFAGVSFFEYVNNSTIDLSRYQILNKEQIKEEIKLTKKGKPNYLAFNCFVYGLEQSELIRNRELKYIKFHCNPNFVRKKEIEHIAHKFKICFVKYTRRAKPDSKGYYKSDATYYGEEYINKRRIDFFDFEGHFVLREKVIISNKTKNKLGIKQNKIFIDNLLSRMLENGYFIKHDPILLKIRNIKENTEIEWDNALNDIEDEQFIEENDEEYEESKKKIIKNIFFADFEALLVPSDEFNNYYELECFNEEKVHVPFLLAYNSLKNKRVNTFTQYNINRIRKNAIFTEMLDNIIRENHLKCNKRCGCTKKDRKKKKENIIYFHNLKYDLRLIENFTKGITFFNKIESNGMLYSLTLCYKKVTFKLIDSLKIMSISLEQIGKDYCVENNKVANFNGLYDKFTLDNILEEYVDVNEFGLSDNQKEEFARFIKGNKFRHMDCYEYYLEKDVLTLREGMITFNKNISSFSGMKIWDSLTISSMAYKYLNNRNSLKGIYKLKGNTREFCQRAIAGGRVATLFNKRHIVNKILNDFDAVNLYPSAMYRMLIERIHLPIGEAKLWKRGVNDFKEELWKGDITDKVYFICEIMITKVNKNRPIPFISVRTKNGGRCYTNSMKKLKEVWINVDKITIEDWEKFQEIEYEMRNIIYWADEYEFDEENHIGNIISELYEARKEARKTDYHGPLQNSIKQMMLSIYGKLCLKPADKITKYKPYYNEKTIDKTDQWLIQYRKSIGNNKVKKHSNGQLEIKLDSITCDHENNVQLGCLVLSMSKRIMNEVMALADDLGIEIYYQDTDSMHIEDDKIGMLSDAYRDMYGRELIGSELGQFHTDFNMNGCKDVVSIKSIFLGKKMYIDRLRGINKVTGEVEYDYHIRMKGAGKNVIMKFCQDNDLTPYKFYEMLFNGEVIALNLCDGGVKFDFSSLYIKTKSEFFRDVRATAKN